MIFLHSSFRTSSTFYWSRLRKLPRAVCYYEIFHEHLAVLSHAAMLHVRSADWNSHHPDAAPYFLEFLPLLKDEGGVEGFDPSMSYESFIPRRGPAGSISNAESNYVHGLVSHAEERGKIPVLTAVRSLGRVAGLKAAVPGLHIVIYRNLFQQWCSYTEQAVAGNPYFLNNLPLITRHNAHDPVIRSLSALYPVDVPSESDRNTFFLFIFMHLYLYVQAAASADHVLDGNRLVVDSSYRKEVEALFAGQDLPVDLSSARNSIAFSMLPSPSLTELQEQLSVVGQIVIGAMPSEVGQRFANNVLHELLEEYDRQEFYAGRMRSMLVQTLAGRNELRAERDHVHSVLAAERANATTTEQELRPLVAQAQAERDAAAAAREQACTLLTAAETARDAAVAERDLVAVERNHMSGERDRAAAAAAQSEAVAEAAEAECEALRQQRAAALAHVAQAGHLATALAAERDAMRAERDAALAQRDQVAHDAAAETARRGAAEAALQAAAQARDSLLAEQVVIRRWAAWDRSAVLGSLSWRLTRPLRRLGIDRPNRPQRPPQLDG